QGGGPRAAAAPGERGRCTPDLASAQPPAARRRPRTAAAGPSYTRGSRVLARPRAPDLAVGQGQRRVARRLVLAPLLQRLAEARASASRAFHRLPVRVGRN